MEKPKERENRLAKEMRWEKLKGKGLLTAWANRKAKGKAWELENRKEMENRRDWARGKPKRTGSWKNTG